MGQSVIVPQNSVAFVGYDHRNGYLCVDLGEASGQTAYVKITVLELSGAEQVFIGFGRESLTDIKAIV